MPQQDSAILRTGSDVTIRGDVALGAAEARYDPKVAVDDLGDFS